MIIIICLVLSVLLALSITIVQFLKSGFQLDIEIEKNSMFCIGFGQIEFNKETNLVILLPFIAIYICFSRINDK